MRQDAITAVVHVGLDVHARTIAAATADTPGRGGGAGGEVRAWGTLANTPADVDRLVARLEKPGAKLCFWYEAGPCGYGLWRRLTAKGHACHVVAPSLIPRRPGDRVKTDRRDAESLARLGRAGELTGVWVPGPEQEAVRDLVRCRGDAKGAQTRARQQLGGFLLRHGRHYGRGKAWTKRHRAWLTAQRFESTLHEAVFQQYLAEADHQSARVAELEAAIARAVKDWSLWPMAQALMAMRGVDLITAATVLAELGDLTRFDSPRQLMAYLGLVPSEHSSGEKERRGGITKAGNGHARRVLVESAWSYRFAARRSQIIQARARHAPASVQAIAWKAQRRLCGRYNHLVNHLSKKTVVACTAVARELCGFLWAIAQEVRRLGSGPGGGDARGEPSTAL